MALFASPRQLSQPLQYFDDRYRTEAVGLVNEMRVSDETRAELKQKKL